MDQVGYPLLLQWRPHLSRQSDDAIDDLDVNIPIAQEGVEFQSIDQPCLEPRVERLDQAVVRNDWPPITWGSLRFNRP
jgi:hypothetical protein